MRKEQDATEEFNKFSDSQVEDAVITGSVCVKNVR